MILLCFDRLQPLYFEYTSQNGCASATIRGMGKEISYNYPFTQTAPTTITGSLSYSSQRSHMADDLRDGLSHSCQRDPTYELFHFQNELPCHVLSRIFKKHIKGCSSSGPTAAHKNACSIRTTSLISTVAPCILMLSNLLFVQLTHMFL
jgi:hypothetical protein